MSKETEKFTVTYDLVVIGGGPAGYTAAIHARRRSLTVALVEERELGGTCLNRGCIPTKAYLDAAQTLRDAHDGMKRGLRFGEADPSQFGIDMLKLLAAKERIVKRMSAGIGVLMRENAVIQLSGTASLKLPPHSGKPFVVTVTNGAEEKCCFAKKVILATGSQPVALPIPGGDAPQLTGRILNSDTILKIDKVPEKLLILGGGVIGIEMAQIFQAFGSQVRILEMLPALGSGALDQEIADTLRKSLIARGITVHTNVRAMSVEPTADGLRLSLTNGDQFEATHLLSAVGRRPDRRILDAVGLSEHFVSVDERMRTSIPGLLAPGDVNGQCMLAHAAMEMGRIAAIAVGDELLGEASGFEPELETLRREHTRFPDMLEPFFPCYIPIVIYGDPEIACIGLTEENARKRFGNDVRVGRFPMAANGRAVATGRPEGFVKVVRSDSNDRLLGVQAVGCGAAEMINEASTVFYTSMAMRHWEGAIHAHPTYGEALIEAVADSRGEALHLPPRRSS